MNTLSSKQLNENLMFHVIYTLWLDLRVVIFKTIIVTNLFLKIKNKSTDNITQNYVTEFFINRNKFFLKDTITIH